MPDLPVDQRVVLASDIGDGVEAESSGGRYWSTQLIVDGKNKHSTSVAESDSELGAVVTSVLIALGCFFLVIFFYVLIISRNEKTAKQVEKEQQEELAACGYYISGYTDEAGDWEQKSAMLGSEHDSTLPTCVIGNPMVTRTGSTHSLFDWSNDKEFKELRQSKKKRRSSRLYFNQSIRSDESEDLAHESKQKEVRVSAGIDAFKSTVISTELLETPQESPMKMGVMRDHFDSPDLEDNNHKNYARHLYASARDTDALQDYHPVVVKEIDLSKDYIA